ncbi:MAG: hypothetical protein Q6373_009435 [Candidatus Sigynarchaeota archaeon]
MRTTPACARCKAPMRLVYAGLISKAHDYYRCERCGHAAHVKRATRDPQTRLF